jgi:hypothetical protein
MSSFAEFDTDTILLNGASVREQPREQGSLETKIDASSYEGADEVEERSPNGGYVKVNRSAHT